MAILTPRALPSLWLQPGVAASGKQLIRFSSPSVVLLLRLLCNRSTATVEEISREGSWDPERSFNDRRVCIAMRIG
ncbi:hypothetical protein R1flu_019031 [Riccia fluitans]|uniref:Secreted protein n=1 Tax=Riccia fluitans TaxID=41844 RepID=A0ABD1ZHJ6_9MARC